MMSETTRLRLRVSWTCILSLLMVGGTSHGAGPGTKHRQPRPAAKVPAAKAPAAQQPAAKHRAGRAAAASRARRGGPTSGNGSVRVGGLGGQADDSGAMVAGHLVP